MPSKTKNSFYILLASHRPLRRVWLGPLRLIRRDHSGDPAARAGAGAVPTEAHWGPRTRNTRNGPDSLPPRTHPERISAVGDLFQRHPGHALLFNPPSPANNTRRGDRPCSCSPPPAQADRSKAKVSRGRAANCVPCPRTGSSAS